MTENKPLITVKTLSLKLAKQITCPVAMNTIGVASDKHTELMDLVMSGMIEVIGWADSKLIFPSIEPCALWLIKPIDGQFYWLIVDPSQAAKAKASKNMQRIIPQLFIS